MVSDREIAALFPQLNREVRGRRLVYLDSAATTLKPLPVIEAVTKHLREEASNVHRGAHFLADEATQKYEGCREKLAKFIGAENKNEIVFTHGTTEGVNLLARSLGTMVLQPGDEILLSQMEHHSNIVPWQMIAKEKGATVRFTPVLDDGSLDFAAFQKLLSKKTKIVSLVHLSNALGTINPLARFFAEAHKVGALCVADVAQSIAAGPIRVADLDCDFLVFSGHKMFAPTGVGVLYGKFKLLEKMPPYQGGGSMISEVREDGSDYLPPPHRFEAGTQAIAEIIGLSAALDFMLDVGFDFISKHEQKIAASAAEALATIPGLRRIGHAPGQKHVISFVLGKSHPSDVGAILDEQGIAIRAGHHCCQPLMKRFGIPGTARASFSIYSTEADVQRLAEGLRKAGELLQ
jgi:cysteine desulfurase/selenocysteine lyase